MPVVTVPKPPRAAYDPNRPVSSLLLSQIGHLQRLVLDGIATEAQAAEYIRALMRRIKRAHPHVEPRRYGRQPSAAKKKTTTKTTTKKVRRRRAR